MALTVNTNMSSLVTQKALGQSKLTLDNAMERLASGIRINHSGDDAAGLAISARMEAQISAFNMAIRNANDGISMTQTAEGAMEEITAMLQRMRELAMASANGTYSLQDRQSLDLEVQQLKEEIDRIAAQSVFNGRNVLDGTFKTVMQVGVQSSEAITVNVSDLTTNSLGGITGTTVSQAVTAASFVGVEAEPTVTRLDFQGDDSYDFILKVEVPAEVLPGSLGAKDGTTATLSYNISGDVANSGAGGVVAAINQAIRNTPDHVLFTNSSSTLDAASPDDAASKIADPISAVADIMRVSYNGRSVTLENMAGLGIGAESGAVPVMTSATNTFTATGSISRSGAEVTFTSIAGGSATVGGSLVDSDTLVLGPNDLRKTTLNNAGVTVVPSEAVIDFNASGTSANLAVDQDITFVLDGVTVGPITLADQNSDSTVDAADLAAQLNAHINLPDGFAVSGSGQELTIVRADGADFEVTLGTFNDASDAAITVTAGDLTIADTGASAANLAVGTKVDIQGGTETESPVLQSVMYLDMIGRDTYELEFNSTTGSSGNVPVSIDFAYGGTTKSLEEIAVDLEVSLNAGLQANDNTLDFEVSVEDGRIKIVEQGGNPFNLTDFSSVSSGRIMVSNEHGQTATSDAAAALLDDTVYADSAMTYARQAAIATDVTMSFSHNDTYSFTISDGTATAVVSPTMIPSAEISGDDGTEGAKDPTAMAAAIRVALKRAGLDGVISVEVSATESDVNPLSGEKTIRLVHRLGREINVANFKSESSGEMFIHATPQASQDDMAVGVTRILNDDTGSTSKRVKDVAITTESLASDSLEVLDRAIEDVNMERAFLGAIQNRLRHTIDNLTSMATNTAASKSRILDTDYAQESANLAKAQVLQQAGTAMLAQANASSQTVLSLLQG